MLRRTETGATGAGPIGRRAARALLAASLLQVAGLAFAPPAAAFSLFGITLFGDKAAKEPVIDPLRYSVTLEAPGADKAVLKKLKAASTLIAGEKRPVSGAIGLLAKARDDREILVATLYEEARYDGVVDVTIAGRPLDFFRRTRSSTGRSRCRWRSRSTRAMSTGSDGSRWSAGRPAWILPNTAS